MGWVKVNQRSIFTLWLTGYINFVSSSRVSGEHDIIDFAFEADGAEFESDKVFEEGELKEIERPGWMEKVHGCIQPVCKYKLITLYFIYLPIPSIHLSLITLSVHAFSPSIHPYPPTLHPSTGFHPTLTHPSIQRNPPPSLHPPTHQSINPYKFHRQFAFSPPSIIFLLVVSEAERKKTETEFRERRKNMAPERESICIYTYTYKKEMY